MLPFNMLSYGNIIPKPVEGIVKIETGIYHIMALTNLGNLYARGYNGSGSLGTGDNTDRLTWTKVRSGVKDLYCGSYGTLVQDVDLKWYCTGPIKLLSSATGNTFVECTSVFNTLPVSSTVSIQQLVLSGNAATGATCLVLMSNGTLYGCGPNGSNEMTGATTASQYGSFKLITTPTTPAKIFGGYDCSAYVGTDQFFYYSGFFYGQQAGTTVTRRTAWTLFNPAGTTNYKVQDFHSSQYGSYFYCLQILDGSHLTLAGGYQNFGHLANGSTAATVIAAVSNKTWDCYTLQRGWSYFNQHVVASTGVWAAGYNGDSNAAATGTLGNNSTTNATAWSTCPLPAGTTSVANAKVYHCLDRVYLLDTDNGQLYGTGTNTTYSTITGSTVFAVDMPVFS